MDSKHRIYILFLHTTKRLDRGFTSSPHRILIRKRKTKTAFYILQVGGKVSRPILKRAASRLKGKGIFKEKAMERNKPQTRLGGKVRKSTLGGKEQIQEDVFYLRKGTNSRTGLEECNDHWIGLGGRTTLQNHAKVQRKGTNQSVIEQAK